MKQRKRRACTAGLMFALATCLGTTAIEAQAARPTVAGNAAAIADNADQIAANREAICALVDQTNLTPRPAFCPPPPTCPCWPNVTPSQILAALEFENTIPGNIEIPACLLIPGTQAAASDYGFDGEPSIQAAISGAQGICQTIGVDGIPDAPITLLTLDQAITCVGQLEAIIPSVSWCQPPPP